ncbi:MAG: RNA polymerase sigma factor [Verrucomicrobiaceae bacterium]|nr:MAG: RNA polymerase sigma factor [Verrucomicrobiaceae bacterium]
MDDFFWSSVIKSVTEKGQTGPIRSMLMIFPSPLPDREKRGNQGECLPDFAEVYENHAQAVYYLVLRWLGDSAKAEDATHDVFLKAFRHLKDFRRESEIRTWLYRIAVNHCKNLRSAWHQRHVTLTLDGCFDEGSAIDPSTPLRMAEARDLGLSIQQTLDTLPEEYRLLLLLVADEELSYGEIGILTGQSCDAVRGKLHRARRAFAGAFRKLTT